MNDNVAPWQNVSSDGIHGAHVNEPPIHDWWFDDPDGPMWPEGEPFWGFSNGGNNYLRPIMWFESGKGINRP